MSNIDSYGDDQYIGMMDKPYLAGDRDYLDMVRWKTWEAGSDSDLTEYSEFQKPYGNDNEDYPSWEWTWPDKDWPTIPPIDFPDPVPHPCSIDEDCIWAGVVGPDSMECDQCFTWSQAHLWLGCEIAPWWAAFGSWEIINKEFQSGDCKMLFSGPVMATVCCDSEATGKFNIKYQGPLDCVGDMEVEVTCKDCCNDSVTLTGSDTVAAPGTWYGTISPACNGYSCVVESNSGCVLGCEMNDAGSTVTVSIPSGACGGFTVTIWDEKYGCYATASKSVRITTGTWRLCGGFSAAGTCSGPWCGSGIENGPSTGDELHKYNIICWGGGICINGDRALSCDDGWYKWIQQSVYCCNGCQDCTNNWLAMSGAVWAWECTGSCGT